MSLHSYLVTCPSCRSHQVFHIIDDPIDIGYHPTGHINCKCRYSGMASMSYVGMTGRGKYDVDELREYAKTTKPDDTTT